MYPDLTIDDAYRIQAEWLSYKLARGERLIGHKIGLTSRAMQQAMNITTPDSGFLTDKMVFEPDSELVAAHFCDPKLEVELAFVLAQDLAGADLTVDDVLDATEYVTPAVELIAARSYRSDPQTERTRTSSTRSPTMPLTPALSVVADKWLHAKSTWAGQRTRPPKRCDRRRRGWPQGVLGHPAKGIAWLAQRYAEQDLTLEAGHDHPCRILHAATRHPGWR